MILRNKRRKLEICVVDYLELKTVWDCLSFGSYFCLLAIRFGEKIFISCRALITESKPNSGLATPYQNMLRINPWIIVAILIGLHDQSWAKETKLTVNDAVDAVFPSIVRIEVVSEIGSGGRMKKSRATGSGVIISKEGVVITNHHVAGKATRITCRLSDGEEVMADLLGADPMTDLAVLLLRLEDRRKGAPELAYADFANSDEVEVGDLCFAMGSPAGLSQSVTRGIISNVAMISPRSGSFRLDGESVGELVRWLGHDAVIFPGNSGGPLVNEKGEIIGINEVGIGSLGGAIPANLAKSISSELIRSGYVSRSWTGLECQPVLDSNQSGILVAGVIEDSPADKAGFVPGDLIQTFSGKKVSALIPEELPLFNQLAYGMKIGRRVVSTGLRNGKKMTWKFKTERREPAYAKESELKSWGITARNFTLMSSLEARRKNPTGAQVHSVNRGGPSASAKPSLLPGDVIEKIGEERINSTEDLFRITHKITRGKTKPVPTLVTFERDQAILLSVINIGPENEENQPLQAWKPWLGVFTQVLTRELSEALELPRSTRGVRIAQVFPETPAERGGLTVGDLIFRIDDQIISAYRTEDSEVFGNMIKEYRTDSTIRLQGLRNAMPLDINVTLEKRPPPPNELPDHKDELFEFTVRELSFGDRVVARLKTNQHALMVDHVESAGWAELAGLRQGDLLLEIEGNSLRKISCFKTKMNELNTQQPKRIVFFVQRGIHTLYLELEPDWQ